MTKQKYQKGLSLVEVLISSAIISIVVAAVTLTQISGFQITQKTKDKVFAQQKAVQMLEELRSFVQDGGETTLNSLDVKDDGILANPLLTTEQLVNIAGSDVDIRPGTPTSGNIKNPDGNWKFYRLIEIRRDVKDTRARKVKVSVYYSDQLNSDFSVKAGEKPLASLSTVLRTVANANVPTQVIDAYALTIDNIQGWWSNVISLKPTFQNLVTDLEVRNPGLDFRIHYINRLSYGRNPYYIPYINEENQTHNDSNLNHVYYYPGRVSNTKENNANDYYYSPSNMVNDNVRISVDGEINNSFSDNKEAYVMADQFNHSVRYPEERAIHKRLSKIDPDLEPTYRLLVEEMNSTDKYKNAIFSNLHGELFPFIPLRNYADPAKDTKNLPNVRVVTHPEKLKYDDGENRIGLRVYSYLREPNISGSNNIPVITLFIPTHNKVGSGSNYKNFDGTVDEEALQDPDMPNFEFENDYLDEIKDHIKILYLEGDSSSGYKKLSSHYPVLGQVQLRKKSWVSGSVTIPAGTIVYDSSQPSLKFQTLSPVTLSSTSSYASVDISALIGKYSPESIKNQYAELTPNTFEAPSDDHVKYADIRYAALDKYNNKIKTFVQAPLPDNKWDITLNPSFDYDGDGFNEQVNGILITLKNTPTRHSQASNKMGLPASKRLYGMEYIPSPVGRDLDNKEDLAKNTARWIIEMDLDDTGFCNGNTTMDCFQQNMLSIETRIGNDLNSGLRMDGTINTRKGVPSITGQTSDAKPIEEDSSGNKYYNDLENLSRTFVWHGKDVPATERYQILGDPRYTPYSDLITEHGYNWFFSYQKSSPSSASDIDTDDYNYLQKAVGSKLYNDNNRVDIDVYRMFQIFREGLLRSNAIYTSMTGYSYYYYGIGGEVGGDDNNTVLFNVKEKLVRASGSGVKHMTDTGEDGANEITGHSRLIAKKNKSWVSLPWVGELYPDSESEQWKVKGNLELNDFYRARYNDSFKGIHNSISTSNTLTIGDLRYKRLQEQGCAAFFNGSSSTNRDYRFDHIGRDKTTGTLSKIAGAHLASGYNLPLPEKIEAYRPFLLDRNSNKPQNWKDNVLTSKKTLLTLIPLDNGAMTDTVNESTVFYKHDSSSSEMASAVVRMDAGYLEPSGSSKAHVVVNGLAPQGAEGKALIAKYSMATMLETFFKTGNFDNKNDTEILENRTVMVPLLEITDKTTDGTSPREGEEVSSGSIRLSWDIKWKRWDGKSYSSSYPANWQEKDVVVKYNVMYSTDGNVWKYIGSSQKAEPGVFNPDFAITDKNTDWSISGLEQRSYIFRVEGFRFDNNTDEQYKLHHSFHQREFYNRKN